MRALLCLVFCLAVVLAPNSQAQTIMPIKTGEASATEAQKVGVPTRVGSWKLVRHIPGEHGHFLYANDKRTFSLFVTETRSTRPLQPQTGWKTVVVTSNLTAYEHQDARNPERTALVFKHLTQRRMLMGKLTEAELLALARLIR